MSLKEKRNVSLMSAVKARNNFDQILERASGLNEERFVVGKKGDPKVVIMGIRDYMVNFAPPNDLLDAIHADSVKNGTDKLTLQEINQEIAAARRERSARNASSKRRA